MIEHPSILDFEKVYIHEDGLQENYFHLYQELIDKCRLLSLVSHDGVN